MHFDILDEHGNVIGSADSGYSSKEECIQAIADGLGIDIHGKSLEILKKEINHWLQEHKSLSHKDNE